jgi:hypothetical protein
MSESKAGSDATAEESATEQPEDAQTEDAQTEVFANRAARRAKGKTTAKPEVFSKGQQPVGRGAVQNPRQYGNRRSG